MELKVSGVQVGTHKTIQPTIIIIKHFNWVSEYHILGPVTLMPGRSYADVTLYFDNVTMTGLDQVLYVDLVLTDAGSGVNVSSTRSTIILEPIGEH